MTPSQKVDITRNDVLIEINVVAAFLGIADLYAGRGASFDDQFTDAMHGARDHMRTALKHLAKLTRERAEAYQWGEAAAEHRTERRTSPSQRILPSETAA